MAPLLWAASYGQSISGVPVRTLIWRNTHVGMQGSKKERTSATRMWIVARLGFISRVFFFGRAGAWFCNQERINSIELLLSGAILAQDEFPIGTAEPNTFGSFTEASQTHPYMTCGFPMKDRFFGDFFTK